jgi:hypothetical protein
MIEVIPCSTEVKLKRSDFLGVITGILIRDERIAYYISYFEDGNYKENMFAEYEFVLSANVEKTKIGFK